MREDTQHRRFEDAMHRSTAHCHPHAHPSHDGRSAEREWRWAAEEASDEYDKRIRSLLARMTRG